MNRLLLTTFLLSMIVGIAQAQPRGQGPKGAGWKDGPRGNPAARMIEQLGLSEEQATQVEAIFEDARAMHQSQREESDESFCAIRAATHARVMEVLNEDQQALLEEHKSNRDERGAGNMRGEHGKGKKGKRGGRGSGGRSGGRQGPPDCTTE